MAVRVAARIYRNRHGMYYFRHVIPVDLRDALQVREVRLSLHTERRHEAIGAALPIVATLHPLVTEIRRMTRSNNENDKARAIRLHEAWMAEVRRRMRAEGEIERLEQALDAARQQLAQSVPKDKARGVITRAWEKGQLRGKNDLEERLAFPWPAERTVPFSELLSAYLSSLLARAESGRRKPLTPKAMDAYRKEIGEFVWVMGDMNIGAITRRHADEFFATLRKLPANANRVKAYRDKSVPELLAMEPPPPPQSEANASKKLERISAMFKWALEEKRTWGIDSNPFTGKGQAKGSGSSRRPFEAEELTALFEHSNWMKRSFPSSYAYWLMPLALFTGARLGELCQLDLKDFVEVEGVPCIDINDEEAFDEVADAKGRKKRVKNANAKRLVPIHPQLIELGLLRHVERLRQGGKIHLFSELSRTRRDGPGHAASNWFQRYRKACGLTKKQETVFHSFRHTFITQRLDDEVPPHLLAPIVGHETGMITGDVYWNKKNARKRLPTVTGFKLPDEVNGLLIKIEDVNFEAMRGPKRIEKESG